MHRTCRNVLRVSPTLLMALALLCSSDLLAAQSGTETPEQNSEAQGAEEKTAGPTTDGMIVVRDRDTGEVRQPTAEEMAELQELIKSQTPKKRKTTERIVQHRSGMQSMVLDESYFVFTVVEQDAEGKYQVVHHAKRSAPERAEPAELEEQ